MKGGWPTMLALHARSLLSSKPVSLQSSQESAESHELVAGTAVAAAASASVQSTQTVIAEAHEGWLSQEATAEEHVDLWVSMLTSGVSKQASKARQGKRG